MSDAIRPPAEDGPDVTITRPGSRKGLWTAATIGAVLLGLVAWFVVAQLPQLLTAPAPGASVAAAGAPTESRKIQATLFYVSADGTELVPTSREVIYGATPGEQARRIIEAQVQNAPEGLASAIPAGTIVRAVFLTDSGDAYVDLGGAIVTGHSGGSLNEALTVYAIVNTLCTNIRGVEAVQILIEGKEVDTLAGHLDLRQPLVKSLDWVRKGQ